jgi:SAM-dependent methyltransferase
MIEKTYENPMERKQNGQGDWKGKSKSKKTGNMNSGDYPTGLIPITKGWNPTCDCGKNPVPALVLDPFCGSGTVLRVARDIGRHAIGIDISEEYKKLATKRADLNVPDIMSFGGDKG